MIVLSLLADLSRFAAETPAEIALATPGREWSFAELDQAVGAVATRLRAEGVRPRALVAIDLPAALEWIVDLALFRLAARGASLRGIGGDGGLPADVLITGPGAATLTSGVQLKVDEQWIANAVGAASAPPPLVLYPRPDSICRIMLTSGTTGLPRAAAYSVEALEHRRLGLHAYWADDRAELNFMALSTTGGFHSAVAALQHGLAYRAVDAITANTMRFAADQGIRVLAGSPVQVARAIEIMGAEGISISTLEEVRLAGATPSPGLVRLVAEKLGAPLRSIYGSTEGGGVTMRMLRPGDEPAEVGSVLPSLELQVVDADGTPVAAGVEGAVRYRGPGLVSGYYVGGAVVSFAGGWFSPGDTGLLDDDGALILAGRTAELLNIAGAKLDPVRIDSVALDFPGIEDAAAFGFERRVGITELGLAIVAPGAVDLKALERAVRPELKSRNPLTIWRLDEIPRNRMGKADRPALAARFLEVLAG